MGINVNRVVGDTHELHFCAICMEILEDPLMTPNCEHIFCKSCLSNWLKDHSTCPKCRKRVNCRQLRPSRICKAFLSELKVRCQYENQGCKAVLAADGLRHHEKLCDFSPDAVMKVKCRFEGCDEKCAIDQIEFHESLCPINPERIICCTTCGYKITKQEQNAHCCIKTLSELHENLQKRIDCLARFANIPQFKNEQEEALDIKQGKKPGNGLARKRCSKCGSENQSQHNCVSVLRERCHTLCKSLDEIEKEVEEKEDSLGILNESHFVRPNNKPVPKKKVTFAKIRTPNRRSRSILSQRLDIPFLLPNED